MQKGVALYITIVIMAILLAIVLGVSAILMSQIKIIKGIENSVIAFHSADTGIEKVLRIIFKDEDNLQDNYLETLDNNASYDVEVKRCPSINPINPNCNFSGSACVDTPPAGMLGAEDLNCAASRYCVKSKGTYPVTGGVQRAIEISYGGDLPTEEEFEHLDESVGGSRGLFNRYAQIFTVGSESYIADGVGLYLTKDGSPPGNVTVNFEEAIFDVATGGYIPNELSVLDCNATIVADSLPTAGGGWTKIGLTGSNCNLVAGQQYAIIVNAPGVTWAGCNSLPPPRVCADWSSNNTNPYNNGNAAWLNVLWQAIPAVDLLFRIYGCS